MPKKKKAKQEAAPAPKPAKKPKYEKSYSPWPAVLGMVLTVVLSGASMAGVHTYQTYRDEMLANQRSAYEQAQLDKSLALRDSKWDLIRPQNPQSPEPEAAAASTEPVQAPETPPAAPEEPSPAPTPDPSSAPSQTPQDTQTKAPSTPSAPAANQTPVQAEPQETTKPAEEPSSSGGGQQSPGMTIAPSNSDQTSGGNSSGGGSTQKYDRNNWPEGKFLASKNGKKYHRTNCEKGMTGAVKIKPENEVWYDSEEAAKAAGLDRCGNCW